MSQYAYLADPDPEFTAASAGIPTSFQSRDVEVMRQGLRDGVSYFTEAAKWLRPADSEYHEMEHRVHVEGGEITVRCFVPTLKDEEGGIYPLLVNFHGGGWTLGGLDSDDLLLRHICVAHKVSVVNVDYRLAPEHPFPVPMDDCYAGLKWAADNTALLHVSLAKGFIVHGMSAGGNLAAAISHLAKNDPFFQHRPLTGQILQIPAVVHVNNIPEQYKSQVLSYEQNAENLTLPAWAMHAFFELYGADPANEDVFPLLKSDHTGLPPAVIQVCGMDPLRDEGILYAQLLQEAGINTKLYIYPGVPHAFYLGFSHIKQGRKYIEDLKSGLQWLLDEAV